MLERLAEVTISPRHVAALTEEFGEELRQARDQRTEDWLHHRRPKPAGPIPQAVAVAVDGGCMQTRAPGQGPGVHEQGWKEDKVACLHTLAGPTFADDPQPNPPACFLDPHYVDELVQELKSHKRLGAEDEQAAGPTDLAEPTAESVPLPEAIVIAGLIPEELPRPVPQEAEPANPGTVAAQSVPLPEAIMIAGLIPEELPRPVPQEAEPANPGTAAAQAPVGSPAPQRQKVDWPPKRLVRTCVATQQNSDTFGPLVAQEAYARGFFSAPRRAFLGDGLKYNWTIQRKWFKDFEPIADFIHPLSYLYVAATAVSKSQEDRWQLYLGWMTACWQGRVGEVLQELVQWQERLGPILPEEKPAGSDARVVVGKAVTYLENNQARMDYPRYRRLGLPVTSSAVESLIKEFNHRVKGTEKFWNRPEGTERILQVRAAVLSEDDRLSKHLKSRPGSPHRRYRVKDRHQ
jgi:hypothetical protein